MSRSRKPAVMFQGTSSNAGKSVLAAAFCRVLLRRGFSAAPFKAQNMALNSYVTPDGREIGRAQATQALACRLEPDARMNPVLLKPSSDTGSQVIIMGRPVGNMAAREYFAYKRQLFGTVKEAYDSLSAEHDVMVIEGAGSPAEINLKAHDIVNMAMADYAEAAVMLVGDIDRGGVFAHLVGTMELLDPHERALVKGFILNRFRGDASLLDPALEVISERTGVPFAGVVPWTDHGLPEEDSVSFKEALQSRKSGRPDREEGKLDIVLLDLPHIANFTDFDALGREPDVNLRVVDRAADVGTPDALLIPGSKNTPGDLAKLKSRGFGKLISELAASGRCEIVGICGGFQMLGRRVADPGGLESRGGEQGFGLLDIETELASGKVLRRTEAEHLPSGLSLSGYEIHHGRTVPVPGGCAVTVISGENGEALGFASREDPVWGTYLHGVFDAPGFRRRFLNGLRKRRGLEPLAETEADGAGSLTDVDSSLDRMADVMEEHCDIEAILRAAGIR